MKKRTTLDVCMQAIHLLIKVCKFFILKALQYAIYELPFASLSRRVTSQNRSYENLFHLRTLKQNKKICISMQIKFIYTYETFCTRTRFETRLMVTWE